MSLYSCLESCYCFCVLVLLAFGYVCGGVRVLALLLGVYLLEGGTQANCWACLWR